MAEALGTAKINLTLDASDYTIALERAKAQQAGLGKTAEDQATRMTAAQRKVVQSLDNQIAKLGLTREQWLQYKVITQTTGTTQEALLGKIKANTVAITDQGNAAVKTANAINQYGLSQKQQVAAMRQVPAQVTDIFVSLQGGQNPLTVLLQQGGQLKDVFGGIRPAVAALTGQLVAMINPLTVIAGAAAAVGIAFANAESEQKAFAIAIAQSGANAQVTVRDLQNMAGAISNLKGVTTGSASDTLAAVASTGRFTAEQIMMVATAAEQMRVSTGKSVEETIATFVKIKQDPVKALLELAESGVRVTDAQYDLVKSLQSTGDTAAAQAVALKIYNDNINNVTKTVDENIGYLQQFAKEVKNIWAGIVDAVMGIGRATTNADLIKQYQSNIEGLEKARARMRSGSIFQGGVYGGMSEAAYTKTIASFQSKMDALSKQAAGGANKAGSQLASQERREWEAITEGNKSRRDRQLLEEQRIVNLGRMQKLSQGQIDLALKESRARYAEGERKPRSGATAARGIANASASEQLQAIKNEEAVSRNAIQNSTRLLQEQYGARIVSAKDYYVQQRSLLQQDTKAQVESLEKQLAYLKSRDVAGKDSIRVAEQIGETEAKLAKVRGDGANALEILSIKERDAAEKRQLALDSYRESLQLENQATRQSVNAAIARITMGEREAAQQERIAQIIRNGADKRRELAREFAEDNDKEKYDQKLSDLQSYIDEQVRITQEGYERMQMAQSNWLNGVRGGVADWIERTSDVASQTAAITNQALDGAADAFAQFALTGKFSMRSLLADIGREIVKFMMKQAVLKFIEYFAGSWLGGGASAGTGMTDFSGGVQPTYAAKGGAFPGARGLSAYSGTVVSQPTPFLFAKGAGIMGEAGHEGIFPLERGRDGKLGVRASGSGGDTNLNLSLVINSDGSKSRDGSSDGDKAALYKQFMAEMGGMVDEKINRSMMPGGTLWKAGVGMA